MNGPPCAFCGEPVNPADTAAWTQVTVWVHGPKRNGACMQSAEVLHWAHDGCARLARQGNLPDQKTLF